jgi:hypothetical protein
MGEVVGVQGFLITQEKPKSYSKKKNQYKENLFTEWLMSWELPQNICSSVACCKYWICDTDARFVLTVLPVLMKMQHLVFG